MFEHLKILPPDPILGLNQQFQQDSNPQKINLSIGVYQDVKGQTPIFDAVKLAEKEMLQQQQSKAYIAQAGDADFNRNISRLLLGDELVDTRQDRVATVMTPGGCGALRMGAELLVQANRDARLWVSDPTWANHYPLLESAGLKLSRYSYFDESRHEIDFPAMLESLNKIPHGDVVLLHGCCHNPTGADLTTEQWDAVVTVLAERNLLPFLDVAYQGFGDDLDQDAYGARLVVEKLPEVLIASSCSKNFGLYRERTGALIISSPHQVQTQAAISHVLTAARRSYSMAPYHGGGVVGHLLNDPQLTAQWKAELAEVRQRMMSLRDGLAEGLNAAQSKIDFSFVSRSKGMFCYLGIPREDVLTLRSEFAIYLLDSTRINIAGLSTDNLPVVIDRVAEVLNR